MSQFPIRIKRARWPGTNVTIQIEQAFDGGITIKMLNEHGVGTHSCGLHHWSAMIAALGFPTTPPGPIVDEMRDLTEVIE